MQPAAALQEQVFLNENGITVTNARFIVPNQMFAMAGITSVSLAKTPPSIGKAVLLVIIGFFVALFGFAGKGYGIGATGLACLVLGILWAKSLKPTYHVALRTAAGEQRALSSQDQAYIVRVVEALSNAIISRG